MNITKMHKVTIDERPKYERVIELKASFLDFKARGDIYPAINVIKCCLSLVNDVIEYSKPIRLDECYKTYAESFIESSLDRSGHHNYFTRFDYDHAEFLGNGLSNDMAPRFYCKDWFSTVVGVLELNGMTLLEIENVYYEYLKQPNYLQTTIFDYGC